MSKRAPTKYNDLCHLTHTLLEQYTVKYNRGRLNNIIACVGPSDFEAYMNDIGVTFESHDLNFRAVVSTVNHDAKWIHAKLTSLIYFFENTYV